MNITSEQRCVIEAALYVSGSEGLNLSDLALVLETDKKQAKTLLEELMLYHNNNNNSAFRIEIYNNKYLLLTKKELNSKLVKLAKIKYKNPLTPSLMEVLTVVAYNGPILKKEIEKIKPGFRKIHIDEDGNSNQKNETNCDYALRRLKELELIEGIVNSSLKGNPIAYKVTGKFLDLFGLKNIKDLPKINKDVNKEQESE